MKILIADDSAFMRTILRDIILKGKWSDAEIIEASDGPEAIEKFKAELPDLVLLDIIMPTQSGIDVLKEIGHAAKSIVIVSSVDQSEVVTEAKSLGAKDYIVKPFVASQVEQVLETLLAAQEA